jgi:CRP-like cAMP-binding protein
MLVLISNFDIGLKVNTMVSVKPAKLPELMKKCGELEKHSAGQIFHSQDFSETLFMLKRGYVKRYQITTDNERVIELIYGPGHIFPLSQLYKKLFGIEQNQKDLVYVYQAMSNIEILRLSDDDIIAELQKDPELYIDLYYEAGLRLKSNIDRLASNALKDDYKKMAHQLTCLTEEYGEIVDHKGKQIQKIAVPLDAKDMAEQLNISVQAADAVLSSLSNKGIIIIQGKYIMVPNVSLLKDVYL